VNMTGFKSVPREVPLKICGILPEGVWIYEDAIEQMHFKGAKRVLELPSNPDNPTPMTFGQGTPMFLWSSGCQSRSLWEDEL
jgi:hypothetical protein